MYILRDWITSYHIDIPNLSSNRRALSLLEAHLDEIRWYRLATNPDPQAIAFIEKHLDRLKHPHLVSLSDNPNAVDLLRRHPDKIVLWSLVTNINAMPLIERMIDQLSDMEWRHLSSNPNAVDFLQRFPHKIDWSNFSTNPNPKAIQMLLANPEKINWYTLSGNENAVDVIHLIKPQYYFDWVEFSATPNKKTVDYISTPQHLTKLYGDWTGLSRNPYAVELLRQHPKKIDLRNLAANPSRAAMRLLREYMSTHWGPEKYEHDYDFCTNLSMNPFAIDILREHKEYILKEAFSKNPALFVVDPSVIFTAPRLTPVQLREYKEDNPAYTIILRRGVRAIERCLLDPSFSVCRRRLQREFYAEMNLLKYLLFIC